MTAGKHNLMFLAVLAAMLCVAVPARAQPAQEAVESGREALSDTNDYPWYDAENDRIRRIDVEAEKAQADARVRNASDETAGEGSWGGTGSGLSGLFGSLLQITAWLLLGGLLALIIFLLIRAALKRESFDADVTEGEPTEGDTDADRVEKLPFDVKRPQSDLLGEAQRQYEQGNFNEAVIYLFSYQLVQLDKRAIIRLTRGKTNRQYLLETRTQPPLFELLENTMIAFEDVFFGNRTLSRRRFETCFHRLDEFHNHLEQVSA